MSAAGRARAGVRLAIGVTSCVVLGIGGAAPALAQISAPPDQTVPAGTTVDATGSGLPALFANGAAITVDGSGGIVAINTALPPGFGVVYATNGGTIDLGSGSIVTAEGFGAGAGVIGATGLFADVGSIITADNVTVSATSDRPYGIYSLNSSVIALTGLTTLNIASNGPEGWGIISSNGGLLTAENVNVTMAGTGGALGEFVVPVAAFFGGQTVVTGTTNFNATGQNVEGVVADNAGSIVSLNNLTGIATATVGHATGADGSDGGSVLVTGNAQLAIIGATQGMGLAVFNGGSVAFTGTSTIFVTAPQAYGLFASNGGTITLNNSATTAIGGSAQAVRSEATDASKVANISVSNSTLASSGDGIAALGGTTNLTFTGVILTNGSGLAINTASNAGVPGILNFIADSSQLTGFAATEAGSTSNVTLQNGTLWTMTGSSVLTSLTNDASTINFTAPTGDPTQLASYKQLAVTNYVGRNGTISLNTFLGNDNSPSDRLVINGGTATGFTTLLVNNTGGPGDQTVNGILVVDAINGGTTAAGAFGLGRPVIAGAYEYQLFRGGVSGNDPDDWFLRSQLDCTLPSAGSPPCPGPGPGPTPPLFRQEVSLYAAIPALALLYGRALIDTMHERLGGDVNLPFAPGAGAPPVGYAVATGDGSGAPPVYAAPGYRTAPSDPPNGAWGRVIAQHGDQDGDRLGIYGNGPQYDFDFMAVQAGLDLFRTRDASGNRTRSGIYAAFGEADSSVTHFDGLFAGRDRFAAYTVGGYWTWLGRPGWYVDAVAQGTFYDVRAQSTRIPALETDGWGFAASLEGGHPFRIHRDWTVEPQLQLVYQTIDLGSATDIAARVRFDDVESLAGRAGVRFVTSGVMTGWNGRPWATTAWVRPSIWQDWLGDPRTQIADLGTSAFIPFRADLGQPWAEINTGITAQVDRFSVLFASVSYEAGLDGRSEAWDGKLGFRVQW